MFYKNVRNYIKKIFYFAIDSLFIFKKKKYVLFVVRNEIMFSYARPIYEHLNNDKRLRIYFCFPAPQDFLNENLEKLRKIHKFKTFHYPLARFLKWDLIFFPDHWPYFRRDCRQIYIGHGVGSSKKVGGESYVYGRRSCHADNTIIYDKIFTRSEYEHKRIEKYYPRFYSRSKVVGSLLVDEIKRFTLLKDEILRKINFSSEKKILMVVSTWGPFSFIQTKGLEFISKIPDIADKYNIIISIHHNNFEAKYSGGQNWQDLLGRIKCKNVFTILDAREPYYLLANADILLTDITSLGLYFPILERPIIFFDNENVRLEPDCLTLELRKVSYVIKDLANIKSDIVKAIETFSPEKMKELSSKIFSYIGSSWQRYAQEIYDSLSMEPN